MPALHPRFDAGDCRIRGSGDAIWPGRGKKLRAALAVRRDGREFQFGLRSGDGWVIGGDLWLENPAVAVPRWAFSVVDLWLRCRPLAGKLGGPSPLPCSGGVGDQPAALMDAFDMLDALLAAEQSNDDAA